VDTCIGNDKPRWSRRWNMLQGRFLEDLQAARLSSEFASTRRCALDLHVDHVGWNTRWVEGRWVPTFPNARYLFARTEWEHWSREPADPHGDVIGDSVRPIADAGLPNSSTKHRLTDEVWPSPRRVTRPAT
jgi:hypothetical protein